MLSEEQKQSVKDDLNLRYTVLRKNYLHIDNDTLQDAALGMCEGTEKYDNRIKYSSYLSYSIIWKVKNSSRIDYRQIKIKNKLKKYYYSNSYEENFEFKECNIKDILKSLDKRSRNIMILYCIKKKTFREIAPLFNVTYQRIEQIYKESLKILKKGLYDYTP